MNEVDPIERAKSLHDPLDQTSYYLANKIKERTYISCFHPVDVILLYKYRIQNYQTLDTYKPFLPQ